MTKGIAAFGALLAALVAGSAAQAQTFRLACPSAATSATCMTADRFAEEVAARSGGRIEVQVFPAGQLGSGQNAIQHLRAGVLDFVVEDLTNYGSFIDAYNVVSWGFAFRDTAHFQSFLASDLHAEILESLRDQGIEMIAPNWRNLPRVVVATRPIHEPGDLAGMRFRVPPIPAYVATWSTLGANPTQVPWSDSYQALRTGIVDGMESPLGSIVAQGFHLAAPNVSLTNHVHSAITVAMNGSRFTALSEADQTILKQAGQAAADYSAELADEIALSIRSELEAGGATIIEVDQAAFASVLQSAAMEQEAAGLWPAGLYTRIQDLR